MVQSGPGNHRTPLPLDFRAFSINCGVRKYRPDLGLIFSKVPCTAVATYTQNTCHSTHIHYCKKILPSTDLRAVITNSGQANTATGEEGRRDNAVLVEEIARLWEIKPQQVASASTGVIGVRMDMKKILPSLEDLKKSKSSHAEAFATAIMTTDLVPKAMTTEVELEGGPVRITGICKGSGMIHPNMATMLAYVLTDAEVKVEVAQELLTEAVDESFNMISVDGETSPNDTVFLLANGAAKVAIRSEKDLKAFKKALMGLCCHMAKSIARDGEGASKLMEVEVKGLDSIDIARRVARSIVVSPLIKTAVHGGDPNWGRVYSRVGQEGVPFDYVSKMSLWIGETLILENGHPIPVDYYQLRTSLDEDEVEFTLDFNSGAHRAVAWGCDLTKRYVDINTEYN